MLHRPFSIYSLLTFAPLLLLLFIAACGPAAPRETGREAATVRELPNPVEREVIREVVRAGAAPAERETAAEIAALAKEVAAVKAQLAQLTEPGVTVWSAVITPVANAGNAVWTRASGETGIGTISGETGAAAARLLKIQLTTASKDLTVTTPGPAAAFTGQTLRIGDNYLSFRDQADSATYSSNADQTVWSFVGDYTPWYQTGSSYQVSVLAPINAANLLPDPIPAATAIPGHLLGYADDINQVPLSLLDDRYRRQVPANTPEVLSFPANPATGDSVILLHPDAIQRFYTGTVTQPGPTLRAMAVNLTIPGGSVTSLQGYIPTLTGSDSATLRGKVFVITSGSPTSLPQRLSYKGSNYDISQTAATNLPGFYEVSGLLYAGLVVGEKPQYAFTLADGNIHPSSRQYQPDPYTFNGSSWELTPGSVSRWAEAGKPDKIPSNKLTAAAVQVLHTGPGAGISIANSGQTTTQRFAFTAFTPAFDLTAAGKGLGTITVRAKLRLTSGSPSAIGFDDNTPTLRGTSIAGIAFASAVKVEDDYSSAADNGEEVGKAVIYNGATTLGTVFLYVAHDDANALGYYLSYTGKSGSLMFDLDLVDLEVGFIPNDRTRSIQGGKLATWTAQTTTPTGWRKPNWSIESPLPGTGSISAQLGNLPTDQHNRIRVDRYTPTAQCFGWLFIAKVSGTEVARAVVTLSPTGIIPPDVKSSSNVHPGPALTRMYLGNSQFLVITYHSILNGASGQNRINISPQPTGFDAAGKANAWTTWPANLTVELYEAVIN